MSAVTSNVLASGSVGISLSLIELLQQKNTVVSTAF
jgi:hypothetical protein